MFHVANLRVSSPHQVPNSYSEGKLWEKLTNPSLFSFFSNFVVHAAHSLCSECLHQGIGKTLVPKDKYFITS